MEQLLHKIELVNQQEDDEGWRKRESNPGEKWKKQSADSRSSQKDDRLSGTVRAAVWSVPDQRV